MLKALFVRLLGWLRSVLGRSPYDHLPKRRIRDVQQVTNGDGEVLRDSLRSPLVFVSRHGLLVSGVSCPVCKSLAARVGEFHKIVPTKWGDAILCSCRRMLLASPDDDIDPVKPGTRYDESIYHRFAKPDGFRVRPQLLKRTPRADDWVYILDYKATVGGTLIDLDAGEGRVQKVDGDMATVELAGNAGMGGSGFGAQIAEIPLTNIRVLATPTLHKGDPVRIIRGDGVGREGTIRELDMSPGAGARTVVATKDGDITTVIERVEKIHND